MDIAAPRISRQLGGDPDWWRGAVIYQIYPRSFQDTNGDGIGDLPGITQRLPYIASLNVDAIWISPFFVSPMDDFGYDVANYCDVDPMFGTLADFDDMRAAAHAKGLRIIIDLVLSHTSDRHPWFVESRMDQVNDKADWYVWADPKEDGTPPTNWLSFFGGPAWEWDTRRHQYYMHNYLASQPDLNYHNPTVQDAILDVARFWLDRGVDGFRLDTANMYFHDAALRDNPPAKEGDLVSGIGRENPFSRQKPMYNINRPETPRFHERLRALTDRYKGTVMVGEIGAHMVGDDALAVYTAPGRLHMAYGFDLLGKRNEAAHFRTIVERAAETGASWTSWPLSNHDVERVVTRFGFGPPAGPMLLQLLLCLGGTPTLYQGEELGLANADVPFEHLQDPYGKRFWPAYRGRDGCRTPMPWRSDDAAAGFTTGTPWLPVDAQHRALAVDAQEGDPASPLARARAFIAWRGTQPALKRAATVFHDAGEPVLAFIRGEGAEALFCAFNLSERTETCRAPQPVKDLQPAGVTGGSVDGRTVRLEPFGVFIGAVT